MVEDVEHGVVFIKADFQAGVGAEGDVAKDDAKAYGYEQQGLEVLLDGKPDEDAAHNDHHKVGQRGVGEAGVGEEVEKLRRDKFSESHGLSYRYKGGPLHHGVAA